MENLSTGVLEGAKALIELIHDVAQFSEVYGRDRLGNATAHIAATQAASDVMGEYLKHRARSKGQTIFQVTAEVRDGMKFFERLLQSVESEEMEVQ